MACHMEGPPMTGEADSNIPGGQAAACSEPKAKGPEHVGRESFGLSLDLPDV